MYSLNQKRLGLEAECRIKMAEIQKIKNKNEIKNTITSKVLFLPNF